MSAVVESASELVGTSGGQDPDLGLAAEIDGVRRELAGATASEVVSWSVVRFGRGVVLTSSFQDCVLLDVAVQVDPRIRIVFLDTGYHFPETLEYLHLVEDRYGLEVEVVTPALPLGERACGTPGCCQARKVEPLNAVLAGARAWMTGVKRVDTPERAAAPVVAWDPAKNVVKVNPIVAWTEDDVESYVVERGLPRHPLNAAGYQSIGCAPTTRPVADGEDPRAGRWPGSGKTECGLHL